MLGEALLEKSNLTINKLRDLILLIIISISVSSFCQIKTGDATYTKYKVNNKLTEIYQGKGTNENILNNAIKYKINNPDSTVHFQILKFINFKLDNFKIIDTLQIYGSWHITGTNGNYFRLPDCGDILKIEADTAYFWQKDLEVIRIKTFGKTYLKLTDRIPFQFIKDSIKEQGFNHVTVQTFATEFHGIKYYVDNVLEFDLSDANIADPGEAIIYGQDVRRHTHKINNLEPNKTYLIMVEGNTKDGRINFREFRVETLK